MPEHPQERQQQRMTQQQLQQLPPPPGKPRPGHEWEYKNGRWIEVKLVDDPGLSGGTMKERAARRLDNPPKGYAGSALAFSDSGTVEIERGFERKRREGKASAAREKVTREGVRERRMATQSLRSQRARLRRDLVKTHEDNAGNRVRDYPKDSEVYKEINAEIKEITGQIKALKDAGQPLGSKENPYTPKSKSERDNLKVGKYYWDPDGILRRRK